MCKGYGRESIKVRTHWAGECPRNAERAIHNPCRLTRLLGSYASWALGRILYQLRWKMIQQSRASRMMRLLTGKSSTLCIITEAPALVCSLDTIAVYSWNQTNDLFQIPFHIARRANNQALKFIVDLPPEISIMIFQSKGTGVLRESARQPSPKNLACSVGQKVNN
jgi:hypothetical protein